MLLQCMFECRVERVEAKSSPAKLGSRAYYGYRLSKADCMRRSFRVCHPAHAHQLNCKSASISGMRSVQLFQRAVHEVVVRPSFSSKPTAYEYHHSQSSAPLPQLTVVHNLSRPIHRSRIDRRIVGRAFVDLSPYFYSDFRCRAQTYRPLAR